MPTTLDRAVGVDPVIAEARKRWAKCDEAEDAQRRSILAAKQFRAGDQWPAAVRLQREGATSLQGQAAQPPRPCLTIDRLSQPIRQLSNTIKHANFAIAVLPNGQGADEDTAEIYQGYLRRVQNQARAEGPIEWAADGAIEAGLGWFRIRTEYVHETWEGDPHDEEAYDQELRLERITNSLTVYCDPSAMRPTRSDAHYMFVTEDLDKDEFARRWPKADLRGIEDFAATGDMKGWVGQDTIRIAEYWRITYTNRTIDGAKPGQTRLIRTPKVEGFKISATEILERWEWLGSRIPLVPILGEELNVDGKPVLRGITQEGMDAQRMVNYTYSGAMEIYALGSKAPYIAAAGQVENYKTIWQTANTFNYAYLPYDPISITGTLLPPPQATNREAPIQASVALMLKSEEAIKATTGIYDPSLEYNNPREHSGRAIQSLQAQSDITGSNYPMNVSRALIYAGDLMIEILPKLVRVGQILHILGADDEPQQVMAGVPYEPGPTGQPQPVQISPEEVRQQKGIAKFYDLTQGKYAVTVAIGKANATKREEGAAALGDLIPHLPPAMAAVATPDYVEQLSFPGAHAIAEKLRKALPPELQPQPEQGQPPDPAQLMQQVQAMQGQLQQAKQIIEGEQMKQQATIQKAQLDNQTRLQEAEMDRQTRLAIAEINANAGIAEADIKAGNADLDRRLKLIELFLTAQQEQRLESEAQIHEHVQGTLDKAHEVGLTSMQHAHDHALAAQEHQQALDQIAATPAPSVQAGTA